MQIMSEKLIEDNFCAWKSTITNFLKQKGYQDYIKGANKKAQKIPWGYTNLEHTKLLKDWHQGLAKAMYWFFFTMSNNIIGHV